MDINIKEKLLSKAKDHVASAQVSISAKLKETKTAIAEISQKLFKLSMQARAVQNNILNKSTVRAEELSQLYKSPYFIKCEIKFDGDTTTRVFYFSKFTFPELDIYSWTAPAAQLRFEDPGQFIYKVPEVGNKSGELLMKEQYMITNGKIVFMAMEGVGQPRELVHQEYFSQHKSTFALPEIVEQMEKSQDLVIRAHPQGSFLVSGPAGSGKTTLALHRVGYLIQSPDSAGKFTEQNTIVFVQDPSTKKYFTQLLPQLGINNVTITTFIDWVKEHFKIVGYKFTSRIGNSEQECDQFEYEKYQAIKQIGETSYATDPYAVLDQVYQRALSENVLEIYEQQKKQKQLDRFDYTALAMAYIRTLKGVFTDETHYKQLKGGKVQRTNVKVQLQYNLMVLDEVQNYLPEQIEILRSCLRSELHAMVYVGDLAQQTQLCTVRSWDQVGEDFAQDRKVVLHKNYRSTKQIMQYIKEIGYDVDVPDTLRDGPKVEEHIITSQLEELEYVNNIVKNNSDVLIGVIAKSSDYLVPFKEALKNQTNVHVITINEAQGVEFDIVFLVGMHQAIFSSELHDNNELLIERKRVDRDLLYVGLTRAMNQLHVLGDTSLQKIVTGLTSD